MIHFLVIGIILGLPAGLTPGPLLALVVSETLQHNMLSGIKVAVVPLLTDIPIILLTLLILAELSGFHHILGVISLTGGCVLLFMGWQVLRSEGLSRDAAAEAPASLTKGILANVLNPHPYLFWIAVGAPIMHKAMAENIFALMAFIGAFYTMLVGAKIVLAVLVGKSKLFLSSSVYGYALRFFGLVLCVFSLFLFHEGLKLLGLI